MRGGTLASLSLRGTSEDLEAAAGYPGYESRQGCRLELAFKLRSRGIGALSYHYEAASEPDQ